MNFFKNVIPLIVLFCINSVDAKPMGGSRPQTAPTPVVKQPVVQQPAVRQPAIQQPITITQEKSYKDLVNYVKNASNVWDGPDAILNSDFVFDMIEKVKKLNLDDSQLEALLQTARDIHGIFTSNQNRNIYILQSVDKQIKNALRIKNSK